MNMRKRVNFRQEAEELGMPFETRASKELIDLFESYLQDAYERGREDGMEEAAWIADRRADALASGTDWRDLHESEVMAVQRDIYALNNIVHEIREAAKAEGKE